jgi:hypothetical protein
MSSHTPKALRKNTGLLPRRKTWFSAIRILCHAGSPEAHDLAMKEKALGKLDPIEGEWKRFQADDSLLEFLSSL